MIYKQFLLFGVSPLVVRRQTTVHYLSDRINCLGRKKGNRVASYKIVAGFGMSPFSIVSNRINCLGPKKVIMQRASRSRRFWYVPIFHRIVSNRINCLVPKKGFFRRSRRFSQVLVKFMSLFSIIGRSRCLHLCVRVLKGAAASAIRVKS
jgi:hypothetical protein